MSDLHYQYRLEKSTISEIVCQVCQAICVRIKPISFPELNRKNWIDIASEFWEKTNFPNCLGALDGKHIRVIKPEHSGSLYYNYKNYFSVLLVAVCDASYKFTFIDVGSYGKSSDSTVFKDSVYFKKIKNGTLDIPPASPFSGIVEPMPFIFVADEAFGLTQEIMRPYAGKFLSEKKIYSTIDFHGHAGISNVHSE